jgi:pyruvate kinase
MNSLRKTKIVCSLGPASSTDEVVGGLLKAGMNVARFNFSHGTHQSHHDMMDQLKRISASLGIPVAIMLDTKGPEIRTGIVEKDDVLYKEGDAVIVSPWVDGTAEKSPSSPAAPDKPGRIYVRLEKIAEKAQPGVRILIADGLLELEANKTEGDSVLCTVLNNASIGSRKNVNLAGVHPGLPIMSEQDKSDIAFGVTQDIDLIAASFLSYPEEVAEIRAYLESLGSKAKIIAKIESAAGIENIAAIIEAADGVMVARGDLAEQIPDEEIPLAQKRIITLCRAAAKPVITATQMLDSMINNPRPTRAELTDVANAIFDGTDAVMLSGETANGKYPVEAVATMNRIALKVEQSDEYKVRVAGTEPTDPGTHVAQAVAEAAYHVAQSVKARLIVTSTLSGNTTRMLARFRPPQPILAITPSEKVRRQLLLDWGVFPYMASNAANSDELISNAQRIAIEQGFAAFSDKVVLAAGFPVESPLPLNTVRVLIIGSILSRAAEGGYFYDNRTTGRIFRATTLDEAASGLKLTKADILVCPLLTEEYIPILRIVKAVVCEGPCEISRQRLRDINPRLVWLSRLHTASRRLENGLSVTIDGDSLLIYEGVV